MTLDVEKTMTLNKFDEWWNERLGFQMRSERFVNEAKHMEVSDKNIKRLKEWMEIAFNQGYDQGHLDCYATYGYDDEE